MKSKVILFGLVSMLMAGGAFAQDIEHDDMYFTSKDRAKLRAAQKPNEIAYASTRKNNRIENEDMNPTDSYSARNVNPEYTSRSNSRTAQADEENYFVNNYQYNRSNNYNNFNNNFSNWYGNSWYRSNYWGPSIYSWNSPYYGYYDSWNSPWYDPYWSYNGYSSSFSYYYGNSYNYGWGGSYNYWNRPFYAGNNYYGYGAGFGLGSNWYWNNYRPTTVVYVTNNNNGDSGRGISYGKRPTRGSYYSTPSNDTRTRSTISSNTRSDNSGGRISTRNPEYYNNSWKYSGSNSGSNNNSSYDSRSQTQYNRSSSWNNNNSNNSWNNSGSRSNSNSSFDGGGSRSHSSSSPASTGGGSNGRTRRD